MLRERDLGLLVTAMLSDGDVDEAWETAQGQQISTYVWDALAEARRATHPEDVVPLLEDRIYRTLEPADVRAYRKAVRQLVDLRAVCAQAGLDDHFVELVATLRAECSRRPTWIAALDRAGLG